MTQTWKRVRLFVLCAMAVLASTSLLASAAQAAPPNWMINGAEMAGGARAMQAEIGSEVNLLSNVLKHMIRVTCAEVSANGSIVTGGTTNGTLEFETCKTFYGGKENDIHTAPTEALPELAICKPKEPIIAFGKGKLVLHVSPEKDLIKFEQNGVEPFAMLDFGPECAAGELFEVTGTLFVQDTGGDASFLTEKETHTFREAVGATLKLGGLFFGARAAALDGTADVRPVAGGNWSGLPE